MNHLCEADTKLLSENALRFASIFRPLPALEYVQTISSLVGAAHILALFEEGDTIKIYFDDKRYVDKIMETSLHIAGRHIKVDYVVPPGIKVYLSKIDPIISNYAVTKLLSTYGMIVSPVISPPLFDDANLCHIRYGVRYVYMFIENPIPKTLNFTYGNQFYTIDVEIESSNLELPYVKTDCNSDVDEDFELDDTHSVLQDVQDPVIVSSQGASLANNSATQTDSNETEQSKENACGNKESLSTVPIVTAAALEVERIDGVKEPTVNTVEQHRCLALNHLPAHQSHPMDALDDSDLQATPDPVIVSMQGSCDSQTTLVNNLSTQTDPNDVDQSEENANGNKESLSTVPVITPATLGIKHQKIRKQTKKKIGTKHKKEIIKSTNKKRQYGWYTPRRVQYYSRGRKWLKQPKSPQLPLSHISCKGGNLQSPLENKSPSKDSQHSSSIQVENLPPVLENQSLSRNYCPLTDDKLLDILNHMKYHRAPLRVVRNFFGKNYNSNTLKLFIRQVSDFRNRQTSFTFKMRIDRILKLFSNGV